jgi:uncharacterized protein Yka (UPF0111/DUF47 family)
MNVMQLLDEYETLKEVQAELIHTLMEELDESGLRLQTKNQIEQLSQEIVECEISIDQLLFEQIPTVNLLGGEVIH